MIFKSIFRLYVQLVYLISFFNLFFIFLLFKTNNNLFKEYEFHIPFFLQIFLGGLNERKINS